jgi:hypothetical protein
VLPIQENRKWVFFATMEVMLALEFFGWWYGQGWRSQFQNMERRLTRTSHLFSVPSLLRTLFSPWRRIITYPGAGLEAHARAVADNFVSRMVGFVVRIMVLFSAGVILALVLIASTVELILWPLLPLAVPASLVRGIMG